MPRQAPRSVKRHQATKGKPIIANATAKLPRSILDGRVVAIQLAKRKSIDVLEELQASSGHASKRLKEYAASKSHPKGSSATGQSLLPLINPPPTKPLDVFVFGTGENGELGLGQSKIEATRPRLNTLLSPNDNITFHVAQLDCGGMHTVALTVNNRIITWGVNDKGALGRNTSWNGDLREVDADADYIGDLNPLEATPSRISSDAFPKATRFVQVAAGDSCSFALTDSGLVYGWGTFINSEGKEHFGYIEEKLVEVQYKPVLVPGLRDVTQLTCGANHALALDIHGNVWAWGVGEQGQLGRRIFGRRQMDAYKPHRVEVCRNKAIYIASGQYHSFVVDSKDNVWAWGLNSYGETGNGISSAADADFIVCPTRIPDLCGRRVTVIAGGAHHSVAITADGQSLVWGRMDGGQLGVKFTQAQLNDPTVIRRDDFDRPRICLRPTPGPNIGKAIHASCGTDHTIFINAEGKAFGTGFGTMYQLGLGSDDDADVAQEISSKHISDRKLCWSGAGGQFSMVAAPADQ